MSLQSEVGYFPQGVVPGHHEFLYKCHNTAKPDHCSLIPEVDQMGFESPYRPQQETILWSLLYTVCLFMRCFIELQVLL